MSTSALPEREKSGCAAGIALALCVLGVAFCGVLLFSRMLRGSVDSEELARDTFIDGCAPFGLVSREATDFLGREGAVVARFALPEERVPQAVTEGDEDLERPSPDPLELILVRYHSPENLRELFAGPASSFRRNRGGDSGRSASEQLQKWEAEPDFAWRTQLLRESLRWDGWETDFQIHRSFTDEGTWSDSARINVGLGDRYLAVFARWPDGVQVVREDVRRVARTIRMETDPG